MLDRRGGCPSTHGGTTSTPPADPPPAGLSPAPTRALRQLTHAALVSPVLHRGPVETKMMSVGALEILLTQLAGTIDDGGEGDVVEMGCWQGTASILLRSFLDAAGSDKVFHAYDSFE